MHHTYFVFCMQDPVVVVLDSITYGMVASAAESNGDFQSNKIQNERAGGVNFFNNVAPLMQCLSSWAKTRQTAVIVLTHSDDIKPSRDELVCWLIVNYPPYS